MVETVTLLQMAGETASRSALPKYRKSARRSASTALQCRNSSVREASFMFSRKSSIFLLRIPARS